MNRPSSESHQTCLNGRIVREEEQSSTDHLREFDRIRTCVNKSHNLAPEPLGHKLHIVAPEGVEPSLAEPKPAVLPLYHRAVNRWGGRTRTHEAEWRQIYSLLSLPLENTSLYSCGTSWSRTTFSGFSVLRIHQVCQSSFGGG